MSQEICGASEEHLGNTTGTHIMATPEEHWPLILLVKQNVT